LRSDFVVSFYNLVLDKFPDFCYSSGIVKRVQPNIKMKISNLILLLTSLFISTAANALDVRKINPNDFIGGSPTISTTSGSERSRVVPPKYAKKQTIKQMYRGSSHERALDAQIRNYRASARENERVFGAPYRKASPKKISIEDLIKRGVIKVILGADGKKHLVRTK
jgi:hypothetical protein|tara:strand:+ start:2936 stop:3436 length:501 start_codon:yes stop_codon:yes gene_type:complete